MNDLDDLLAADGSSWRQHVDTVLARAAAGVPVTADRRTRRHRYTAPLLSAAAVAVIALVTALLIGTSHDGRSHTATANTGNPATPTPSVTAASTDAKQSSLAPGWSRTLYPIVDMLTAAETQGLTSMPWKLDGIDDAQRSLAISYIAGGGCTFPRGIYIQETASSVLIESLGRTMNAPQPSQSPQVTACPADLKVGLATIKLQQPLGDRLLLHAQVDPAWDNPAYLGSLH
jgi:hypothetical protein